MSLTEAVRHYRVKMTTVRWCLYSCEDLDIVFTDSKSDNLSELKFYASKNVSPVGKSF